jgi:hypothetical protein
MTRWTPILLGMALFAACEDEGTGPTGPAWSILKVAGDRQVSFPGQLLAQALQVQVTDSAGRGAGGVSVNWTATGGSLSASSSVTDASGNATVAYTLAAAPGSDTVTARAVGRPDSVVFVEFAVRTAPVASQFPVPANYGIHDTFVRDGIAFACVWNTGIIVFDVGDGRAGGTPSAPVPLDTFVTNASGVPGGPAAHNAWWFHNPVTSEKRYLFVGQEGPGNTGSTSSGDIHVVDVSNLSSLTEVATYRMNGAGAHNFWMDEAAQILYAAYYNGGVVALDVSGTLSGNLATREIARIQPGGAGNTSTWGVQLGANGSLYAVDMLSGVWQLTRNASSFTVAAGGNNVPERFSSDLWVHGNHLYSGTWASRGGNEGNAVKIWRLTATGAPTLVDSIITPDIGTVSDVQVSSDGKMLVFSAEGGPGAGLYVYDLADPEKPVPIGRSTPLSLHTATIADINGGRYVFAAKNPGSPAMVVFDITPLIP